MSGDVEQKKDIANVIAYRFLGKSGQYVMGIPARDLTEGDLAEILERENITRKVVAGSELYEVVEGAEEVEVKPFCGAPTREEGRCLRQVKIWGGKCFQHKEVEDDA